MSFALRLANAGSTTCDRKTCSRLLHCHDVHGLSWEKIEQLEPAWPPVPPQLPSLGVICRREEAVSPAPLACGVSSEAHAQDDIMYAPADVANDWHYKSMQL